MAGITMAAIGYNRGLLTYGPFLYGYWTRYIRLLLRRRWQRLLYAPALHLDTNVANAVTSTIPIRRS